MIASIPIFDIIIFSILGLSALMGFVRGITRETLGILSWTGAGTATYFGYPYAKDLASVYIKNPQIAEYATYAAMFIALLVVFSILSHLLSTLIKNSILGGVDRSLGFGFGLMRAVLLLAILDLGLGVFFTRSQTPDFMKNTKTLTHLHYLGDQLIEFMPEKWQKLVRDNQKNENDLKEKIIHSAENAKNEQEKNADDLANIMPKTEEADEQEDNRTPINTTQIDKLLDDGSKIITPITEFLDSND